MNSLRDVLSAAAATGDWITPYAIWQVQAAWWALEIDGDVSAPITGNENAREQAGVEQQEVSSDE